MSTKTSIKRIALVAVSALGFGLLSVVPARAAEVNATTDVSGYTLTVNAASAAVNSTFTVTTKISTTSDPADTEEITTRAVLSTKPAGSAATINATGVDLDGGAATTLVDTTDADGSNALIRIDDAAEASVDIDSLSAVTIGTFAVTADVVGDYVLYVFHDQNGNGLWNAGETFSQIGFTAVTVASAATEASIKGTATAVTASAVSLTTVEPSNRVGVAVIATPKVSFTNTTGSDTSANSHKASVVYSLTKPAGSTSTLNVTSEAVASPALDGTDADGNGGTAGETASGTGTNLTFTPDIAGTYTITMWHESIVDNAVSTSEATTTKSYVISADDLKLTVATYGDVITSADDKGTYMVRMSITGANGSAASLKPNESIVVTRTSGDAAIDFVTNDGTFAAGLADGTAADVAAGTSTYTFNAAQFNSSGRAAFIIYSPTAATTSTWTIVGQGGTATSLSYSFTTVTPAATSNVTSAANAKVDITNATGVAGVVTTAGADAATKAALVPYGTATSVKFEYTKTAATDIARYDVTDTSGNLTGFAGARYAKTAGSATSTSTAGSFTVPVTLTTNSAGTAFGSVSVSLDRAGGNANFSLTAQYAVVSSITRTVPSIRSPFGATNMVGALVKDQFGRPYNLASVTPTLLITDRNATIPALQTRYTNENGYAYWSIKDASTSTTNLVDNISFVSSAVQGATSNMASPLINVGNTSVTSAATIITYVSSLNVGTVSLTTPNTAQAAAGLPLTGIDIYSSTDSTGETGAEGGQVKVSAVVKDTNGSILTGVPVTFAFAATDSGVAVTSTTKTVYTDGTGLAEAYIYGWKETKATLTATAGGVSKSSEVYFAQQSPTEARYGVLSTSSAEPRVVTATVTDRFGNAVANVPLTASILGNGFFGTGTNKVTSYTDEKGQVKFLVLETTKDVTVQVDFGTTANPTTPYGQTGAAAGYDIANTVLRAQFLAPVAGTIELDETGTGNVADFAKAGGWSTAGNTVTIKGGPTEAQTAAEAASDAALEAIDAANAATDAANLAAEAADAATVAAEEARDAADAATAAVEALASEVATLIAGLKAQLTTLAKTVAKIAKKVRA